MDALRNFTFLAFLVIFFWGGLQNCGPGMDLLLGLGFSFSPCNPGQTENSVRYLQYYVVNIHTVYFPHELA